MKRYLFFLLIAFSVLGVSGQKHEPHKIITSLPELYAECNNLVEVHVQSLPDENEYRFEVEGGEMAAGNKKNHLYISPVTSHVTLKVYQGESFVGEKVLNVSSKPRPSLVVYADGKEIDWRGRSGREINQLSLKAQYGDGMKKCVHGEFKIKHWNVVVLKDNKALDEHKTTETETIDISDWKRLLKKGDRILIEVGKVVRVKPNGGEEEVNMGGIPLISIVLQ